MPLNNLRLSLLIRTGFTFYRSFCVATGAITICCSLLYWKLSSAFLQEIIWLKIITLTLTLLFVNQFRRNEFYYYRNLGISKAQLFTFSVITDMLFFIVSLIIANKVR